MVFRRKGKKTTDTQSEIPKSTTSFSMQLLLAMIIVVAAFLLIGVMLSIQYSTINYAITKYGTTRGTNGTLIINDILQSLDRSNQTLFNILLPVFGAWVGVVIAFFFSSEQVKKAQEIQQSLQQSLVQALSPEEEKLSRIKVQDILTKYPVATNVHKVTLDNTIKEVLDSFGDLSNVLLVKDRKPLGILYKIDLLGIFSKMNAKIDDHYEDKLTSHIGSITDFVTKRQWSETGIHNYARLTPDTTLLSTRERMYGVSNQVNDVVGLVMDTNGIATAVVTYDMIVGYIK
jgi:hypothetical protein